MIFLTISSHLVRYGNCKVIGQNETSTAVAIGSERASASVCMNDRLAARAANRR